MPASREHEFSCWPQSPPLPFVSLTLRLEYQLLFLTVQAYHFPLYLPISLICAPASPAPPFPSDLWTLAPRGKPKAKPPRLPHPLDLSSSGTGTPPDEWSWGATFLAFTHACPSLLQVVSPLTESVLGETLLTVAEEKVSITQLQAQVVASLALSLRPSPGSSHTILATAAAQQTLSSLKQVTGAQPTSLGLGV